MERVFLKRNNFREETMTSHPLCLKINPTNLSRSNVPLRQENINSEISDLLDNCYVPNLNANYHFIFSDVQNTIFPEVDFVWRRFHGIKAKNSTTDG